MQNEMSNTKFASKTKCLLLLLLDLLPLLECFLPVNGIFYPSHGIFHCGFTLPIHILPVPCHIFTTPFCIVLCVFSHLRCQGPYSNTVLPVIPIFIGGLTRHFHILFVFYLLLGIFFILHFDGLGPRP